MLPSDPADPGDDVAPPIWLHANCETFVVQQMKYRGWTQDDIDYFFRDWRDDEPNSEKEDATGITPPNGPFSHLMGSLPPLHIIVRICLFINSPQFRTTLHMGPSTPVSWAVSTGG